MVKNLIAFLLVLVSISAFAVDFSYGMSAATAKDYILENAGDTSKTNNCATAKAIVYISEHQDTVTYQNIVDAIGNEFALQTVYQVSLSNPKSDYATVCGTMLLEQLRSNTAILDLNYYKDIVVSANFHTHKTHLNTGIYYALMNKYSAEEIREIISATIMKYIELGLTDNFNSNINYVLKESVMSYQMVYLDCDEAIVKADLKKLNAKAYLLLNVSKEYKTFVTRLRMIYKSLDF